MYFGVILAIKGGLEFFFFVFSNVMLFLKSSLDQNLIIIILNLMMILKIT
jgi:hypothetical protein